MYSNGQVLGATAATAAVLVLPNTGNNMVITVAIAIIVGLIAWGVLYKYAR